MKEYLMNVLCCLIIVLIAGVFFITHFILMSIFSPEIGTVIYLAATILIGSGIFTYFTKEEKRG